VDELGKEVLVKQTPIKGPTSVMFDLVKAGLPGSTHQTVCQMTQPKSGGPKMALRTVLRQTA
jgi:hypothetical protein